MPLLVDRSCPEWQKRSRARRKVVHWATIAFFVSLLGVAMAIDHFFPPVESAVAEEIQKVGE